MGNIIESNSNQVYNKGRGDINEEIGYGTRANDGRDNSIYDFKTEEMEQTISKREYSKREYE